VGSGAGGESPLPRRGPGRSPGEPEWEAMERAIKQYAPKAACEKFISQVWKAVDEAGSFEDLERGLAGLVGKEAGLFFLPL